MFPGFLRLLCSPVSLYPHIQAKCGHNPSRARNESVQERATVRTQSRCVQKNGTFKTPNQEPVSLNHTNVHLHFLVFIVFFSSRKHENPSLIVIPTGFNRHELNINIATKYYQNISLSEPLVVKCTLLS